jgi:hypothetical protein
MVALTGIGGCFADEYSITALIDGPAERRESATNYLTQQGSNQLLKIKPTELLKIILTCSHKLFHRIAAIDYMLFFPACSKSMPMNLGMSYIFQRS